MGNKMIWDTLDNIKKKRKGKERERSEGEGERELR
jgi:hypothetical protein